MAQQEVKVNETYPLMVETVPVAEGNLSLVGTNLNAIAATGSGGSVYTGDKRYVQWIVRSTGVTTGATILIQGCEKDSGTDADWYTISTVTVSATGTKYVSILADEPHLWQRSRCSAYTDGAHTTKVLAIPRTA